MCRQPTTIIMLLPLIIIGYFNSEYLYNHMIIVVGCLHRFYVIILRYMRIDNGEKEWKYSVSI